MHQQNSEGSRNEDPQLKTLLLYFYSFLIFILPVKFSSNLMLSEIPVSTVYDLTGLIQTGQWPWFLFSAMAGIGLFLSIAAYPQRLEKKHLLSLPLIWVTIAALTYFSQGIFPYYQSTICIYLTSLGTFAAGAQIIYSNNPKARSFFINALITGLIWSCFYGIYQYFYEFGDTMANITTMEKEMGRKLTAIELSKISQNLVYSTFTYSNAFAGFLCLTGPFACAWIWRQWPKKIRRVLTLSTALLILINLTLTQSKAAFISLIIATTAAAIFFLPERKQRLIAFGVALVGLAGLIFIMTSTPYFASGAIRIEYALSSLSTFNKASLYGSGPGSFMIEHLSRIPAGYEFSRIPHSFIGTCMQSGILTTAAAIICLSAPFVQIYRRPKNLYRIPAFIGLFAWLIHAQLDMHFRILALCALFIIMNFIFTAPKLRKQNIPLKNWLVNFIFAAMALISCSALLRLPGEYFYSEQYDELRKAENALDSQSQTQPSVTHFNRLKDNLDSGIELKYDKIFLFENISDQCLVAYSACRKNQPELADDYLILSEICLREILNLNNQWHRHHERLAENLYLQRRLTEASESLDKAFELYPYSENAIYLGKSIYREFNKFRGETNLSRKKFYGLFVKEIDITYQRLQFQKRFARNNEIVSNHRLELQKKLIPFIAMLNQARNKDLAHIWLQKLREIQSSEFAKS